MKFKTEYSLNLLMFPTLKLFGIASYSLLRIFRLLLIVYFYFANIINLFDVINTKSK